MTQVAKYIQNELDIAEYRVRMLKSLEKLSPAQKRLLDMEVEFLNIPFHSMGFTTTDEISYAIQLYRTSRHKFYESYGCFSLDMLASKFEKRLEYLLDKRDEFLGIRVQEINVIQNPYFYDQLISLEVNKNGSTIAAEKERISKASITELIKLEPARIGKERARVQAILYSAGLYLEESIRSVSLPETDSAIEVYDAIKSLESIISNLKSGLFKSYNKALEVLPSIVDGTMGENPYFGRIHKLHNLISDYPIDGNPIYKESGFDGTTPQIGYILFGIKPAIYQTIAKDKDKQTKNRVYGILLPMERTGNEKLSLLYKKIVCNDSDLTPYFADSLSNIKAMNKDGEITYFKSLMMRPLWDIVTLDLYGKTPPDVLSDIIGSSILELNKNADNQALTTKINKTCTNFLNLSRNDSIILVAKTRSEEAKLQRAFEVAVERIGDLYTDSATND